MKKIIRILCASVLVVVAGCSEEKIDPQPLSYDPQTFASTYSDQLFQIRFTTNYDDDIALTLIGTGGNLAIDWGDGTLERTYVSDDYSVIEHDYNREEDNPGTFTVKVTGDIKTITQVEYYYDDLDVKEMRLSGLTNLQRIDMGVIAYGPRVIDLSNNRLLESVMVGGVQRLENLILPVDHAIRGIEISGANNLSTVVVDQIIVRVYDSVVKSPRSGFFVLSKLWGQDEDDLSMVGPPSNYTMNKLRKLRRKYGWQIIPEIK